MSRFAEAVLVLVTLSAGSLAAQERPPERVVGEVNFKGNKALDYFTLAAAISTSSSPQLFQLLRIGDRKRWDETEFRRDVLRLQVLYRQHGFYEARIDTTVDRSDDLIDVTFIIVEGPPVAVDTLTVTGMDSVPDVNKLLERLPLRDGRPFNRILFEMSADSLSFHARNHGHPYAMVFRNYSVDRRARTAEVGYDVLLGPHARIGEIVVSGNRAVSERTIRRSLAVNQGDEYRLESLFQSQRALYQTELFRYASVGIDRDSAVGGVDSLLRVRVQVTEAQPLQMRAGAGYGTIDCLRTSATVTKLNFLGGARRLDVVGRVSKLGVGDPLNLEHNLCIALEDDERFSRKMNYLGSVTLTQPSLLIQRTATSVSLFAERRSEINAYLFESFGGVLGFKFGLGRSVPTSIDYRLSQDQTDADPATYCIYFDVCDPSVTQILADPLLLGTLTVSLVNRNTDSPFLPTRGHVFTVEATTASPLLGSQISFDRLVVEGVGYTTWRNKNLSARVRAGIIRQGQSQIGDSTLRYVPPDHRFYAGGPNTVRGYARNEMGPIVYIADSLEEVSDGAGGIDSVYHDVRYSPVGASAILLANAELRVPTPFLAGKLALAVFVDAGELWDYDPDTQGRYRLVPLGFRVTPGAGLQITTPLGPMRLDAAYNGYDPQTGRLYLIDDVTGELQLQPQSYTAQRGKTFLQRLQWHFSVGLAF